MPTVLIVDSSLSMARLACPRSPESPGSPQDLELRHLAVHGLNQLLDHIEQTCRLEHVALFSFSSSCEVASSFTRDLDQVRSKLSSIGHQDKSCLEVGLKKVVAEVTEEWGNSVPITMILVTDGAVGHGPFSLQNMVNAGGSELKLPLDFPGTLSVVCVADKMTNPDIAHSRSMYDQLFLRLGVEGSFHKVEGQTNTKAVEAVFKEVEDLHYKQWTGRLELGPDMGTRVQLCPPPKVFQRNRDFCQVRREPSDKLTLKGFIVLSDLGSPPVTSRHLVLPASDPAQKETSSKEDEARTPNLCVFLHGALKVENMCALVYLSSDWYGIIYSWSDNKKKSSLMLSLFEPGLNVVPWLGSLERIGPRDDLNETTTSPFPVKCERKPSYSSQPVVWIKQSGIQSDIQKILRHARKLPEKTTQFYKELNRLKRAAVCLGFYELLEGVAQICERECGLLPANVSPDCSIQLTHVAQVLRSADCLAVGHIINPRQTNWQNSSRQ